MVLSPLAEADAGYGRAEARGGGVRVAIDALLRRRVEVALVVDTDVGVDGFSYESVGGVGCMEFGKISLG